MALPKVGNLAPSFKLKDQNGKVFELKLLRDKKAVLVYFYPKAMTPGCTVQACGLRDSKSKLAKLDTVALGISPDPVARLKKFADRDALKFILLSDEDHAIAEDFYQDIEDQVDEAIETRGRGGDCPSVTVDRDWQTTLS